MTLKCRFVCCMLGSSGKWLIPARYMVDIYVSGRNFLINETGKQQVSAHISHITTLHHSHITFLSPNKNTFPKLQFTEGKNFHFSRESYKSHDFSMLYERNEVLWSSIFCFEHWTFLNTNTVCAWMWNTSLTSKNATPYISLQNKFFKTVIPSLCEDRSTFIFMGYFHGFSNITAN